MAQMPASASWEPLGETFYRKQDVYSMQWTVTDLSDYIVATAKWGGPMGQWHASLCFIALADLYTAATTAIIRDNRKPVLLGRGNATLGKPKIHIYSSAGTLLQTVTVGIEQLLMTSTPGS